MTTFIIPTPTIEDRVSWGAAVLDEHAPGWTEKLDPMGLDLAKSEQCVLGQLFGSFQKGAAYFYGEEQMYRASAHGFDIGVDTDEDAACAEFEELTAAWLDLLEARCG